MAVDIRIASSNKDYFAGATVSANGEDNTQQASVTPSLPSETPGSPEPAKESSFMGRLKSFGTKKLQPKTEKDETTAASTSNGSEKEEADKAEEDAANATPKEMTLHMFSDVLTAIKKTYESALTEDLASTTEKAEGSSLQSVSRIPVLGEDGKLRSAITPTPSDEAPVIHPAQDTIIIIAEQKVSVDGSMDLYRGTVASVGNDADVLEAVAPGWLAELLLLVLSFYPFAYSTGQTTEERYRKD
jgi:WD repeat-containing protein 48